MAEIVKEDWDTEKYFLTLHIQVDEEQVKVICKKDPNDNERLKVYFDLEKKQKHSMYAIAKCIETICNSYMIAKVCRNSYIIEKACSTIEFEFNGKQIEVEDKYSVTSALEQMAKTVYF